MGRWCDKSYAAVVSGSLQDLHYLHFRPVVILELVEMLFGIAGGIKELDHSPTAIGNRIAVIPETYPKLKHHHVNLADRVIDRADVDRLLLEFIEFFEPQAAHGRSVTQLSQEVANPVLFATLPKTCVKEIPGVTETAIAEIAAGDVRRRFPASATD